MLRTLIFGVVLGSILGVVMVFAHDIPGGDEE